MGTIHQKLVEKATAIKEVSKISKVEEGKDGYTITKMDGWSFYIPKKYGVIPEVGDEAIFYGKPFRRVQGVDIAGKEVFFLTQAELDAEHEAFVKASREHTLKNYKETIERIKDDDSFETIDISGMSGSYEWGCQVMLQAGLKFLKEHPAFHFDYTQYQGVTGICITDTPWGQELDKVILDAPVKYGEQYGATGAMHQAVINHLAYIHKHGYEAWLKSVPSSRRYTYPNIPPPKD